MEASAAARAAARSVSEEVGPLQSSPLMMMYRRCISLIVAQLDRARGICDPEKPVH